MGFRDPVIASKDRGIKFPQLVFLFPCRHLPLLHQFFMFANIRIRIFDEGVVYTAQMVAFVLEVVINLLLKRRKFFDRCKRKFIVVDEIRYLLLLGSNFHHDCSKTVCHQPFPSPRAVGHCGGNMTNEFPSLTTSSPTDVLFTPSLNSPLLPPRSHTCDKW